MPISRLIIVLILVVVACTASGAAFAAVQWSRVATVDSSTATANQACYWSGSTLECNTTNPTITATGLVGIGTTTPTNILSLSGAAAETFWMERGTAAGNGLTVQAGGGLSGGTNENGGTLTLASGISTGTGSSSINFKVYGAAGSTGTADNAAATAMTITGAGLVGIGTTSPSANLYVYTNTAQDSLDIRTNSGTIWTFDQYGGLDDSSGPRITYDSNTSTAGYSAAAATYITSGLNGSTAYNIILKPSGSGNVGIGTTSPGSSLQVNGGEALGYSTSTVAPTNGLAVSGNVAVGTTTVPTGVTAAVNGVVKVAGTGSEACGAAQVGSVRYNPTANYFELCSYP